MIGIACISGFTETDREATGTDLLHREIERRWGRRPDVEVYDLRPWKHDAAGFAALMDRDDISEAIVIGYSWGAGYGSPRLCREILRHGIRIPLVLLCDPVYRPQWLPAWGPANVFGFRALFPRSAVIQFPAGVEQILGVRQASTIPQGHRVQIGEEEPFDVKLLRRTCLTHTNLDSSTEWKSLVLETLEARLGQCAP